MTPVIRGDLRFESGGWESLRGADGLAIVAHWSEVPTLSGSASALLSALTRRGLRTLLVSTCEAEAPIRGADVADAVARRPNRAYDFGSWASCLLAAPDHLLEGPVILANDSLAGPFGPMESVFDEMEESAAHVWGLAASGQFGWHLQSFFLRFAPGLLLDRSLQEFWTSVRELPSKQAVIDQYELGLSRMLFGEGLRLDSFIPAGLACEVQENPMIIGWRGVLRAGLPMVKRELLRRPELVPYGADVAAELRRRYGVTVSEWT